MTKLGNMPGQGSALGINDSDEVVGLYTDTATHAFLWTAANGGTTTNIGATLPLDSFSKAYDINNHGEVVGEYELSDGVTYHAFLYDSATGTSIDLNDATIGGLPAGFSLQQGRAIDDAGQITGLGGNSAGVSDAFLLTPATPGDANLDGKVDVQRPDHRVGPLRPDRHDLEPRRVHRRWHNRCQRPDDLVERLRQERGGIGRRHPGGARTSVLLLLAAGLAGLSACLCRKRK